MEVQWYTPKHVIDLVLEMFGAIELDPFSNADRFDNPNIPALRHFTELDGGLDYPWVAKTVYCNPPYGDFLNRAIPYAVKEHTEGRAQEIIMLLPNKTETGWFQALRDYPVCFTNKRLAFIAGGGVKNSGAPHGNAFFYLGPELTKFSRIFSKIGRVYFPVKGGK